MAQIVGPPLPPIRIPSIYYIMSNYLETELIDHILRGASYSPPTNVYLALYTSNPGETGLLGTEVGTSGTGYTRIQCPLFTVARGVATLPNSIPFPTATGNWGTVTDFGLKDSPTGGNLLFYGTLSTALSITYQERPIISASSLSISLTGDQYGGWGEQIASDVLNFVLNRESFLTPGNSIYLALGRSLLTTVTYNFSSWLEVSGAGYSRRNIVNTGWSSPIDGSILNTNDIIFTENATGNWGNISNCVLFNSSSAGDPLFWGVIGTPRNILVGDGLKFLSNSIEVRIDAPTYS